MESITGIPSNQVKNNDYINIKGSRMVRASSERTVMYMVRSKLRVRWQDTSTYVACVESEQLFDSGRTHWRRPAARLPSVEARALPYILSRGEAVSVVGKWSGDFI